jgi:hypothetical protein
MRFKAVTTFLLILFFASLATLVLVVKKPLCIDSKIVEKIDRVASEGTSSVWRCSLNQSVPYDEKFVQELPDLSRRLAALERFFEDESPLSRKLVIVWLDGMSKTIRIQGPKIFISDDLLHSSDQLERSIVRIWLREKSGESVIDRTLLEGTLVDLIMVSMGRPETPVAQLHWPTFLQNTQGFCQALLSSSSEDSPDLKDRFLICPNSLFPGESDLKSILVGSSRPLLSESALAAYFNLDIKQRAALLKSLPYLLRHLDKFAGSSLMTEESSVQGIELLHHELENIVHLIAKFASESPSTSVGQAGIEDPWLKFNNEFRQQLNRRGFSQEESIARLDYLIEVGPDLNFSSEVLDRIKHSFLANSLVGIADENNLWMLPSGLPLQKRIFGALQSHQLMYLSCEIPTKEKILEFSKVADKFLYVRFCGNFDELNFRTYFARGYSGFAEDNPKLAFVQVHLPSLLQAWNSKSGMLVPALAKVLTNELSNNPASDRLGSKPPIWDATHKMYKTQSVIQAIEAYRPVAD